MNLAGTWRAPFRHSPFDTQITITLAHNVSTGAISGAGQWGQGIALTVTGAYANGTVTLTIVAPPGQSTLGTMTFTGSATNDSLVGKLSGPAFTTADIAFGRIS